jgi:ketosteroid isomerase-like protein
MSDQTAVAERADTVSANADIVRSVYDAFGRKDVPAIFELFHPDCEIYQSSRLPWGGRYAGHAGLGDFLGKLTGMIASRAETEQYVDDEEGHVAAVGYTRGHVVASGQPFEVPEVHVWTVVGGKVSRFESYIDTAKMRQALGL